MYLSHLHVFYLLILVKFTHFCIYASGLLVYKISLKKCCEHSLPQRANWETIIVIARCICVALSKFYIIHFVPENYFSELNTIEGLLERAITALGQDQPVRKVQLVLSSNYSKKIHQIIILLIIIKKYFNFVHLEQDEQ